jgi:hypothetical protein
MVPYLLIADLLNTILSAALVFADHALYPSYIDAPRAFGLAARQDQSAAGAIMWVVGSVAFIIPAMLIAVQCLTHRTTLLPVERLKKRKAILAGSWQHATAKLGLGSRRADAVSFLALFLAAGLAFSAVLTFAGSDEDDLALRAQQRAGELTLSVYAAGDELIVGENDISVLVQDATGSPLPDAQIAVRAAREGAVPDAEFHARESDSDNKLLQSAVLDLPATGNWQVHVETKHEAQSASVVFPARAVVHTPGLDDWWPYFLFPVFGLLLLAVYSRRARRRHAFARGDAMEAAPHSENSVRYS